MLGAGITARFVEMAPANSMILLRSVDQVKIDCKRTDYVDCGIQVFNS